MAGRKKYVPRWKRKKEKKTWQENIRSQLESLTQACQVYLREILISCCFWFNQLVILRQHIHAKSRIGEKHRQRAQANEDKKIDQITFCAQDDYALFAVLDGHGGEEAAEFCKNELPDILGQFIDNGVPPEAALKKSFAQMEEKFNEHARENSLTSGTTCTCAILEKSTGTIYVANIGDCEAIISKRGTAKILTQIHHAEGEKEKARIEAAGGKVQFSRLNGDLEISRSFGDLKYLEDQVTLSKPHGLIAEPHVSKHDLTAEDEFLILASDGTFENFVDPEDKDYKYERCLNIVRAELKRTQSTEAACNKLLEKCGRTEDDITCLIVAFPKFFLGKAEPIIVRD